MFDSFPGLFAAFHALHRLLTPRHPPHALCRLTKLISGSNTSPTGHAVLSARPRVRRSVNPVVPVQDVTGLIQMGPTRFCQAPALPKTLSDTQENDGSFGHPPRTPARTLQPTWGRDDQVIRQGEHPRDAVSDDIEVLSRCHSKIYQVVKEQPLPAVSAKKPEPQTTAVGHVRRSIRDRQASQLLFVPVGLRSEGSEKTEWRGPGSNR